ncbi:MAG: hypothetical protein MK212_09755 [Saprospiraceae bacterium]|nr:hypothetical protein [Saprospiraceae bacterium]
METFTKLLIVLFFLSLHSFSTNAQTTTDLENSGLKGQIKNVKTTVYRSVKKGGEIKLLSISQLGDESFNKAGYSTETIYQINTMSLGEGPKRKTVYKLDEKNRVSQETRYKNEEEGLSIQHVYENDLRTKSKYYEGGEEYLGTEYLSYDDEGNMIQSKATGPEDEVLAQTDYTHNSKGQLITEKFYKNGNFQSYTKQEYKGENVSKTYELNEEGKIESYTAYEYNKKDKLTKKTAYNANDEVEEYTIYEYDKKGNKIKYVDYNADGSVEKTHISEYDKYNNETLRQVFNADGEEENYNYMRYQYTYDKKGNWIQQIEFLKNGNSLDVVKREIEYYK